jgi:hypothetical protein
MGGGQGLSVPTQPRGKLVEQGKPFEIFAKNVFAGSLGTLPSHFEDAWNKTFSWQGSENAPPDLMLRKGDAVEVKVSSGTGQIQLNSSSPKRTLKANDPLIETGCRDCETWVEKNLVYFIGKVKTEYVEALWLIDGYCIAGEETTYKTPIDALSNAIIGLGGVESNEIGRLNKVDPLGVTSLRIRAMWQLEHPAVVFRDQFKAPLDGSFVLNVLVAAEKWDACPKELTNEVATCVSNGGYVTRISLQDPDGSSNPLEAVQVSWVVSVS